MARPNYPPPLISLPEARAIIEGAIAYAREAKLPMAVVVVDHAGNVVSADRSPRRFTGRPRRSLVLSTRHGRIAISAS